MLARRTLYALPAMLAVVSPFASAQLAVADPVPRACQQPVGNASLGLGGLPQVGGLLRLELTGEPLQPFLLLVDDEDYGFHYAGIQACVGADAVVLANGFINPYFVIPTTGTFQMDLPIPDDPQLAGRTFYVQGLVSDPSSPNGVLAVSNQVELALEAPGPLETVFYEDFEAGWGDWWVTNGTWEIGVPTSGPLGAWSGLQCAATKLSGNYGNTSTRLVSPAIYLPPIGAGEELRLNYRAWFSLKDSDSTLVQVSTDGGQTWTTPACTGGLSGSGAAVWSQASANLTGFAGETVLLGFRFTSGGYYSSSGAYFDDIHVFRGVPHFASPQDWEEGIGPWWTVSNGTWEVGELPSGTPPSGTKVAGTRLNGDYTNNTSRLTSPPLDLAAGSSPRLVFWHTFSLQDSDYGMVDVSVDDGCSWTALSTYSGSSGGTWTKTQVDLGAYAGQTVRIAFRIQTGGYYSSSGWFVDDLLIQ